MQRLSSGLRVNTAKDDAAGLAISERILTQVRGMDAAKRTPMMESRWPRWPKVPCRK